MTIKPVVSARAADGSLVALASTQTTQGFEYKGKVYATAAEAGAQQERDYHWDRWQEAKERLVDVICQKYVNDAPYNDCDHCQLRQDADDLVRDMFPEWLKNQHVGRENVEIFQAVAETYTNWVNLP